MAGRGLSWLPRLGEVGCRVIDCTPAMEILVSFPFLVACARSVLMCGTRSRFLLLLLLLLLLMFTDSIFFYYSTVLVFALKDQLQMGGVEMLV